MCNRGEKPTQASGQPEGNRWLWLTTDRTFLGLVWLLWQPGMYSRRPQTHRRCTGWRKFSKKKKAADVNQHALRRPGSPDEASWLLNHRQPRWEGQLGMRLDNFGQRAEKKCRNLKTDQQAEQPHRYFRRLWCCRRRQSFRTQWHCCG
jgi:hypothetical protein